MNFADWLNKIQHKPYEAKIRILWIATVSIAAILIAIWAFGLKNQINNLSGQSFTDLTNLNQDQQQTSQYLKVERVETSDTEFRIFFSVKNPTTDILNFPTAESIELNIGKAKLKPSKITDRQNQNYVRKILSNTENFGIMIFPPLEIDYADLLIKDMYFEKHPSQLLTEALELDLAKLNQPQSLRQ